MTVEEAKDFLRSLGFYAENLWTTYDVTSSYECTEEEALEILDEACNRENVIQDIFNSIANIASHRGLKKIEE
jgi:hypothetical protein